MARAQQSPPLLPAQRCQRAARASPTQPLGATRTRRRRPQRLRRERQGGWHTWPFVVASIRLSSPLCVLSPLETTPIMVYNNTCHYPHSESVPLSTGLPICHMLESQIQPELCTEMDLSICTITSGNPYGAHAGCFEAVRCLADTTCRNNAMMVVGRSAELFKSKGGALNRVQREAIEQMNNIKSEMNNITLDQATDAVKEFIKKPFGATSHVAHFQFN